MALTHIAIEKLKPKAKPYRKADSGGLCIEINPDGKNRDGTKRFGSKLWRWRYYYNSKPQMLALGKFPAVSLEIARRKAEEADFSYKKENILHEKRRPKGYAVQYLQGIPLRLLLANGWS